MSDTPPRNFVDRDMRPCDWETEVRQLLANRAHLSSFGYQRMLRLLVHFVPGLFEERDRLRARVAELGALARNLATDESALRGTPEKHVPECQCFACCQLTAR